MVKKQILLLLLSAIISLPLAAEDEIKLSCGDNEIFYYSTVSITDDFYLDTGDELFLIKD